MFNFKRATALFLAGVMFCTMPNVSFAATENHAQDETTDTESLDDNTKNPDFTEDKITSEKTDATKDSSSPKESKKQEDKTVSANSKADDNQTDDTIKTNSSQADARPVISPKTQTEKKNTKEAAKKDNVPDIEVEIPEEVEAEGAPKEVTADTWNKLKTLLEDGNSYNITLTRDITIANKNSIPAKISGHSKKIIGNGHSIKLKVDADFSSSDKNTKGEYIQRPIFYVSDEDRSKLQLDGVTLDGKNKAHRGPLIRVFPKGTLNIENSILQNNKTNNGHGSAIFSNGKVNIKNSTIRNNTFTAYDDSGNKDFEYVTNVYKCKHASYGGAIYNTGNCTVENSTFAGNIATVGGAIYTQGKASDASNKNQQLGSMEELSSVVLTNCEFQNNQSYDVNPNIGRGGAIAVAGTVDRSAAGSVLTMNGGSIHNNSAVNYGGAIGNSGLLYMNGINIYENTASTRGAIRNGYNEANTYEIYPFYPSITGKSYSREGTVIIQNCNIYNNTTTSTDDYSHTAIGNHGQMIIGNSKVYGNSHIGVTNGSGLNNVNAPVVLKINDSNIYKNGSHGIRCYGDGSESYISGNTNVYENGGTGVLNSKKMNISGKLNIYNNKTSGLRNEAGGSLISNANLNIYNKDSISRKQEDGFINRGTAKLEESGFVKIYKNTKNGILNENNVNKNNATMDSYAGMEIYQNGANGIRNKDNGKFHMYSSGTLNAHENGTGANGGAGISNAEGGTFINEGDITTDRNNGHGISNNGTFTNEKTIKSLSNSKSGIYNGKTMTSSAGTINIADNKSFGVSNAGNFTSEGNMDVMNNSSAGISNTGTFKYSGNGNVKGNGSHGISNGKTDENGAVTVGKMMILGEHNIFSGDKYAIVNNEKSELWIGSDSDGNGIRGNISIVSDSMSAISNKEGGTVKIGGDKRKSTKSSKYTIQSDSADAICNKGTLDIDALYLAQVSIISDEEHALNNTSLGKCNAVCDIKDSHITMKSNKKSAVTNKGLYLDTAHIDYNENRDYSVLQDKTLNIGGYATHPAAHPAKLSKQKIIHVVEKFKDTASNNKNDITTTEIEKALSENRRLKDKEILGRIVARNTYSNNSEDIIAKITSKKLERVNTKKLERVNTISPETTSYFLASGKLADLAKVNKLTASGLNETPVTEADVFISKTITIQYNTNLNPDVKCTFDDGSQTTSWCEKVKVKDHPKITDDEHRRTYIFTGWKVTDAKKSNDKNRILKAGETTSFEGDVTLTAQWKAVKGYVTWDGNGAKAKDGKGSYEVGPLDASDKNGVKKYAYDKNSFGEENKELSYTVAGKENEITYVNQPGTYLYREKADKKDKTYKKYSSYQGWSVDKDANICDNKNSISKTGDVFTLLSLMEKSCAYEECKNIKNNAERQKAVENKLKEYKNIRTDAEYAQKFGQLHAPFKNDEIRVRIYAVWDNYPEIEARDRYFTLEQANPSDTLALNDTVITEKVLLETVVAKDDESGTLRKAVHDKHGDLTDMETGKPVTKNYICVYDYDAYDFSTLRGDAVISITYEACDDAGNKTRLRKNVHVTSTDAREKLEYKYTRFISKKYLNQTQANGGLNEKSIWKTNGEYKKLLKQTLDNLEYIENKDLNEDVSEYIAQRWYFTDEEKRSVTEYVHKHGMSNAKESDALKNFLKEYKGCIKYKRGDKNFQEAW